MLQNEANSFLSNDRKKALFLGRVYWGMVNPKATIHQQMPFKNDTIKTSESDTYQNTAVKKREESEETHFFWYLGLLNF